MAVDDIGLDFIKVRFRRAFAGSTECTPHSDRFEACCARNKKKPTQRVNFFLVDDIGLEPMTFRTSSGCSSQLS